MKNDNNHRQQAKSIRLGMTILISIVAIQVIAIILKATGTFDVNWAIVLIPTWIIGLFIISVIVAAIVIVKRDEVDTMRRFAEGKTQPTGKKRKHR